jgi:tetratricopeptide (TPR) repeat protein
MKINRFVALAAIALLVIGAMGFTATKAFAQAPQPTVQPQGGRQVEEQVGGGQPDVAESSGAPDDGVQDPSYTGSIAVDQSQTEGMSEADESAALQGKASISAADAYYYIGESDRFLGDNADALDAYNAAVKLNAGFAPGYLGQALAVAALNPDADVFGYLDKAIQLDPQFTAAYLERGMQRINHGNPEAALGDLDTANRLSPDSPAVYLYLAQAQMALGRYDQALESARKANELDITLLPAYLVLGQAYSAAGQLEKAVGALQTYTLYQPEDTRAWVILGSAYNAAGDYSAAISVLDRVIGMDKKLAEAYYQRGMAYLSLEELDMAEQDFKAAVAYDPFDFDSHLGLARVYLLRGHAGDAYMQIERNVRPLVKNNQSLQAQADYWEAICLEQLNEIQNAEHYWRNLLELPADFVLPKEVVPADWRAQARQRLATTTPSPTATPKLTPTPTVTPKVTQTPTLSSSP